MPLACLVKISPLDLATNTRVDIYVSNINDAVHGRRVNGLGGQTWAPAIVQAPRLVMRLWDGDFKNSLEPGGASLTINMQTVKLIWPNADTYAWAGAPIAIHAEEVGSAWPWAPRCVGNVSSASRNDGQVMSLDAQVDLRPFQVDMLPARYAGTTGAEGAADLRNRAKPLVIGWAQNVEPVLIDATNSVYQFSAYGAIEEVTNLYERGSDFGDPTGNYATYAALVAATIPPGRWATCLASGMIRLGAPAYGVITGDLKGHRVGATTPRLPGAIISALATIAGVNPSFIETTSLAAMDAARALPHNLVLTENATFLDVARDIALGVNHQSGISLTGRFFVARPVLSGTELIVLEAKGRRAPQVVASTEASVSPPYVKTTLGANRSWRVHSADEIAFMAPIVELGRYNPATTYREGNIVDSADQSRWIYIATTPSAGNAPPTWPTTSNAWWANVTPPFDASGLTYADGTPFENLKPAEPGATDGMNPDEEERLEDVEGAIVDLDAEMLQLAADTAQALIDIAAAEQTVIGMQAEVADLAADVAAAQAEILAAQTDILANATSIASVSSTVASQGAAITSLQTTATSLQGSVASLTTRVNASLQAEQLLQNPAFAIWDNPTGAPTGWSSSSALSRATGRFSPYAAELVGGANVNSVYTQQFVGSTTQQSVKPGDWLVIEAEIELLEGTLSGAGPYVIIYNSAGTLVQTLTGTLLGATGVIGAVTPVRNLVQVTHADAFYIRYLAAGHVSTVGPITAANRVLYHRTGLRFATPAEIRDRTVLAPMEATVATQATAISTLEGSVGSLSTTVTAQGASITTLQTASSTQAGQIATLQTNLSTANANITANATAITGLDSSVASLETTVGTLGATVASSSSAITTLQGQVASLNTTVGTQGASITSMQTALTTATSNIATLQTQVRSGGGNLLTNSEMVGSGGWGYGTPATADGWSYYSGNPSVTQASVNGAGAPWMIAGQENNLSAFQSGAGQVGFEGLWYQDVAVQALKYYEFSCVGAGHRCDVGVYMEWWGEGSSPISYSPAYRVAGTLGGVHLVNWAPLFVKQQAPAGALKARVIVIKYPTTPGQTDSWGWFSRAQMAEVTATEASPVPYSPGNSRATITTQQASINGLFARWGIELDVNGYVSGMVMNNNGARSDFIVRADRFAVVNSSGQGGAPFEVVGGTTYIRNASIRDASIDRLKIAGNTISTSGQAQGSAVMGNTAPHVVTSITLTPLSTETKWLVLISGMAKVGDAAPSGTFITMRCDPIIPSSGLRISKFQGMLSYNMAGMVSGLSGPLTLTLTSQASANPGGGDPHTVDIGRIVALQLEK